MKPEMITAVIFTEYTSLSVNLSPELEGKVIVTMRVKVDCFI